MKLAADKLQKHKTPFFYYDLELLLKTCDAVNQEANKHDFQVHYALKANSNERILKFLQKMDFGADCVSGNEVKQAVNCGFDSSKIVFAGVGKSDEEINYALSKDIFCFNVESIQELEVINQLASNQNKIANVALRLNPNVNAKTHQYITTGLEENKFGINAHELSEVIQKFKQLPYLWLSGLHFHIGSQITDLEPFRNLCTRVNEFEDYFSNAGFKIDHLNVGGGLGINYQQPDKESIAPFADYFKIFKSFLKTKPGQQVHFELGRAIVAQCGNLISRALYIKNGINTNFIILDAGMTELIRPALYQAFHKIENLSAINRNSSSKRYDVVGPICESSDCFAKSIDLPESFRGDLFAIRSCGAYGEVMASQYNLRDKAAAVYSDEV